MSKHCFILSITLLSPFAAAIAQTISLPVVNSDFESGGLSDGQYSNNPGTIPDGWDSPTGISGAFYGYFNVAGAVNVNGDPIYPGASDTTNAGSMSGPNIFYFGSAGTGDILASKQETVMLTVNTQDPAQLAETLTNLPLLLRVPRKTRNIRVAIQGVEGGRIGTAELDRTMIDAAPAAPTPPAALQPRPQGQEAPTPPAH